MDFYTSINFLINVLTFNGTIICSTDSSSHNDTNMNVVNTNLRYSNPVYGMSLTVFVFAMV